MKTELLSVGLFCFGIANTILVGCSSASSTGTGGSGGVGGQGATTSSATTNVTSVANTTVTVSSTSQSSSNNAVSSSQSSSNSAVSSSQSSSNSAVSSSAQSTSNSSVSNSASAASTSTSNASSSVSSGSGLNANQVPCTHGPGWVAFRFHYQNNGGTQAFLDDFGLPDDSNWEAVPAFSTMVTDPNNGGGLEIGDNNWILIRYSLVGLTSIQSATFSVYGRSYDVSASASFDAWSPLYGDAETPIDAVSNAWPYAWTSIDYTSQLNVGDDPGLTGIRLYAGPSSDDLVIHTVELCIDGH